MFVWDVTLHSCKENIVIRTKKKTRGVAELSNNNEKQDRSKAHYIGIGLVFGAGLGVAFGAAFGNIGLGITFGAAFGMIVGAAVLNLGGKGGDV